MIRKNLCDSNLHIFGNKWETISFPLVDITGISGENITPALYDNLSLNRNNKNIVIHFLSPYCSLSEPTL